MSSFRTISILTIVLVSTLLLDECCGQTNPRRRQRNRNTQRRGEGLPSDLQEAYQSAVHGHHTPSTQSGDSQNEHEAMGSESIRSANGWEDLAPSTPASNAVECTVEIYQMRRLGGRCTRLGGHMSRPYICQSGQHFAFDSDCEDIIAARNGRNPES